MNEKDNFESFIIQLSAFVVIILLIIVRIIGCTLEAKWIWIVNYIGMYMAIINLLINKFVKLRNCKHEKYKAFGGFTVIISIVFCTIGFIVAGMQSIEKVNVCINDCITLLALFFSLSPLVWDSILDKIVKIIHK